MRIVPLVFGVLLLLVVPLVCFNMWENIDANEVAVIQDPFDGELHVYSDPGVVRQNFGKVTFYPRRAQYSFEGVNAKRLRFNDGGHANLSGSVSWEMPLTAEQVVKIHKAFSSADGIENQAVAKMLDAAIYMSGPLMSSTESSGERRAELVQYIDDQATNGVYVTHVKQVNQKDTLTGTDRQVSVTEIEMDKNGMPKRQQGSLLNDFSIKLMPISIKEIEYDSVVENQIKQRQDAITQVQIAQANAKRAEQDAITAEKQGEANAAKSKWAQEVIKAQKVTEAQQDFEVAQLKAKSAEQYKREQVLRGEGDGEYKRLVMQADGALDKKLEAWVKVNQLYAENFAKYQGAWVPSIVQGDSKSSNGAQQMIDLLSAKTAKDLSLDMTVKSNR